jgi:YesN/AraC family two-component response regulator
LHSLQQSRQELQRIAEERPELLQSRFERYLEAVTAESGRRLDRARGQLEAGFERMVLPLLSSGLLDEKGHAELCAKLDHAANEAQSHEELAAAYRRAVAELSEARERPAAAKQGRSMRRALEHVRRHYDKSLRYEQVARIAGFSPNYFSQIFKETAGMSFEHYVRKLRVDRAKELLTTTDLPVGRIAERCGFHSSEYFCRVFKSVMKSTPLGYRRRWQPKGDLSRIHKAPK